MFTLFQAEPEVLPTEWFVLTQNVADADRARLCATTSPA